MRLLVTNAAAGHLNMVSLQLSHAKAYSQRGTHDHRSVISYAYNERVLSNPATVLRAPQDLPNETRTSSSMTSPTVWPAGDQDKKLDVVIVGGGVCGLVCAIALAKRGLYPHVYEAAVRSRLFDSWSLH